MDELFAYAILFGSGYDVEEQYEQRLDALFLEHPSDKDLLELECCKTIMEAVQYLYAHMDLWQIDREVFGRTLMKFLRKEYARMELREFSARLYCVWETLPGNLQNEYPFDMMCYADDPYAYGDAERVRGICEEMLGYYE